jgi:hypothetical protein
MVRLIVVEPNYLSSNLIFDVCVTYLWLIILSVVGGVPVDSEMLFDRLCESQDQVGPVFQRCL